MANLAQIYTVYGYSARPGKNTALAFNGERLVVELGSYLLGNGYRAFSPVLMRFMSPDSFSPFGDGGRNSYCYCLNDPVNQRDPDGHNSQAFVRNSSTRTAFRNPRSKKTLTPQSLEDQYNALGNQIVKNTIAGDTKANQPLYEQQLAIAQHLAKTKYSHLPKRGKLELASLRNTQTPMMDALRNSANPLPPMLHSVHVAESVGSDPASPDQTAAQLRAGESVV